MIPMGEPPPLLDPRGPSGSGGGDGCVGEEGGDDGEPDGRSEAGTFSILVTTTASAAVVRNTDALDASENTVESVSTAKEAAVAVGKAIEKLSTADPEVTVSEIAAGGTANLSAILSMSSVLTASL